VDSTIVRFYSVDATGQLSLKLAVLALRLLTPFDHRLDFTRQRRLSRHAAKALAAMSTETLVIELSKGWPIDPIR